MAYRKHPCDAGRLKYQYLRRADLIGISERGRATNIGCSPTSVSSLLHWCLWRVDIQCGFAASIGSAGRADRSVTQGRLARGSLIPRLCGKRADPRRPDARMLVVTHSRRRAGIGVLGAMVRLYLVLAGQSGCYQHGCGNQASRQKLQFTHRVLHRPKPTTRGFSSDALLVLGIGSRSVQRRPSRPISLNQA